jgi:adenylate kinase
MNNVVSTLAEGLLEVCRVLPEDPVDYLAEYLFKHSNETS